MRFVIFFLDVSEGVESSVPLRARSRSLKGEDGGSACVVGGEGS